MLTIMNNAEGGFTVKMSNPGTRTRGTTLNVRNTEDLHTFIDHYYLTKHHKKDDTCIVCIQMRALQKKTRRP